MSYVLCLKSWLELQLHAFSAVYGPKPHSFLPNQSQKMRESQQLFFGLRLMSIIIEEFQRPVIQTKVVHHFGGFFHQIKVRQEDSKQAVCRRMRRLEAFLYLAAQNFELFSKIQKKKRKKEKKTVAVDVLSSDTTPLQI
jgi:hypothetical protein